MKKFTLILLLTHVLFCNLLAQRYRGMTSITIKEKKIEKIEAFQASDNGLMMTHWYDEFGRCIRGTSEGAFDDSTEIIYNTLGLDSVVWDYELGGLSSKTIYEYNSLGKILKNNVYKMIKGKLYLFSEEYFTYDKQGNEILCEHVEKGANWKSKSENACNEHGQLLSVVKKSSNSNTVIKSRYEYLANNCIQITTLELEPDRVLKSVKILNENSYVISLKEYEGKSEKDLRQYSEEIYSYDKHKLVSAEDTYIDEKGVRRTMVYEIIDGVLIKEDKDGKYGDTFRYTYRE